MTAEPLGCGKSSLAMIDAGKLFRELGLTPATVFVDLACGAGAYALEAAGRIGPAGSVHGFDLWAEGISRLQAEAAERGLTNLKAAVADLGAPLPLPDGCADLCLLASVLHDLVEEGKADAALAEIGRILKRPGGRLAVVEFKKIAPPPGPPLSVRLDEAQVEALCLAPGQRRLRSLGIGAYHYLTILSAANP